MSETQLSDLYLYQSSLKSDPEIMVSSGKRVLFVIDLKQGSYQYGVITIDATSQLNGSEGFACLRDAYIMLPYKVSMKNTHATNAQGAANQFCVSLKCGNFNVINSMSLELNGKTIHGAESYLYPDAAQSTKYSATVAATGDGYSNNTAISTTFTAGTISATASVANDGFVKRLLSNPPNAKADSSTSWPSTGAASATTTIADQLGRGAFVAGSGTAGAIMGTWNYMLKIKLTDLHPIFKELDLMANPRIRLRFRVNQVLQLLILTAPVNDANDAISGVGSLAVSWGAVVNALEPTIDGTYMPFNTSRLYVPFLHLEKTQAIISKSVKKVRYNYCYAQLFYQRAGIGKQSTQLNAAFDLQLSASVKSAKYVILLPFAEQAGSFASAAVQQFQSPFDSAPWTLHPGSSIRNFNVRIGSQQCFVISHDYDFHQFANETWSLTNRVLIADVSRLTERDAPQAIQIQGTNAGCQGPNMIVLVVSEQELSYDRLTGDILDYTAA
ncbi:unnamed protein product [Phytophthora lilii]|uniref:Unnamed protein product n=1 Tax=Phytophthora lilii TaxID=2077276 RepID=A0A9W6WQU1_9STRA|nr:unnamed protein product [Phytophthora lilii]